MDHQSTTGTVVERYLFSPLYRPASAWAVIGWWERRRLFYNLAVGTAGLVTVATAFFFSALPPSSGGVAPPLILVPLYGLMANLFYTLGAPVDLLLRRRLGSQAGPVAQAVFRYGLAFAVGLTLLPIPLMAIGWLFSVISR